MRALVVDDSRAMRATIERVLQELEVAVVTAADGREALDRLRSDAGIDLLLLDWNMPEMNGFELLCAVRAEPRWNGIRVMMVTSECELPGVRRALDAGADEYLMKPFTSAVLRDKLALLGVAGR